jgi:tRNA pseudouridine38-40 synthase
MRYFIKFSYNGTHYHGWQQQPNAVSVQETLNKALSRILNTTIDVMGAGRTDTGVHARQMYAHFDFESEIDTPTTVHKLNSYLPKDIAVFDIINLHDDAHARFDAKNRTYEYHINTQKDVFGNDLSWYSLQKLDIYTMNEACELLLKYTDFQCFSKVQTNVATFNCKIQEAYWKQEGNQIIFTIKADRFLRNMVRAIVGTMINIGLEKVSLPEFIMIIESKDRKKAGFSVPAKGLFLTKIEYDYLDK